MFDQNRIRVLRHRNLERESREREREMDHEDVDMAGADPTEEVVSFSSLCSFPDRIFDLCFLCPKTPKLIDWVLRKWTVLGTIDNRSSTT